MHQYVTLNTFSLHLIEAIPFMKEYLNCLINNTKEYLVLGSPSYRGRWGIEYPSLSVCTCMCMGNQLGNYAPTMALVTNCDCHSYVGALRHSMPMITVLNKWIAIFSLIHVFSYD